MIKKLICDQMNLWASKCGFQPGGSISLRQLEGLKGKLEEKEKASQEDISKLKDKKKKKSVPFKAEKKDLWKLIQRNQ